MSMGPRKLERVVLIVIPLLAIVWIGLLIGQRIFVYDQSERQIDLAFSERFLIAATLQDATAPEQLLSAGVTTLVRQPYTLATFMTFGLAEAWQVASDRMHIYLEDDKLTGNATIFLTGQLGMNAIAMELKDEGFQFDVQLPGPLPALDARRYIMDISTGPMPPGFRRALYLPAGDWGKTTDLNQFTRALYSLQPEVVIPDWLGGLNASFFYQSYLHTPWLRKPVVALPEFELPWQGRWAFVNQRTHRLIRIHVLDEQELAQLSRQQIIRRVLRAVVERQINMIFVDPPQSWSLADGLTVIHEVREALLERGWATGPATMPKLARSGQVGLHLVFLASAALLLLFIWQAALWAAGVTGKNETLDRQLTIRLKPSTFRWVALFFLFGLMIIHWQGYMSWSTRIAALLLAVITPVLSLMTLPAMNQQPVTHWRAVSLGLKDFALITGWNLFAGLAIAVLLYQPSFVLRLDLFWGVKLAFILPLIMVIIYLFPSITDKLWWQTRWAPEHRAWTLAAMITVLLIGAYLVLRTGNHAWLPVAAFETRLREGLENWLVIRPRFKEMVIGHPLLLIGLIGQYLTRSKDQVWPRFFLAIGMVGQLSIINTFCHIHTPVVISLWRTLNGLAIGLPLGLLIILILIRMKRSHHRP